MITCVTVAELRSALRASPRPVGLVPTMGFLHEGHLALIAHARQRAATVVASIFVNPLQFGPNEDFDRYPRDPAGDARKLEECGTDVVFAPTPDAMIPPGFSTTVHVAGVSEGMEGARRPGHFDGVATVVARLFGLVQPDLAVFGAKDGQQVAVIRRLALDLGLDVEIMVHETVREPDGLALSSRNAYLSPDDRRRAPVLFRALTSARRAFDAGERSSSRLLDVVREVLSREPALRLDALDLVDADSMRPVDRVEGPVMLAVAGFLGRTRLIDNIRFGAPVRPVGPRDARSRATAAVGPAEPGDGASPAAD